MQKGSVCAEEIYEGRGGEKKRRGTGRMYTSATVRVRGLARAMISLSHATWRG